MLINELPSKLKFNEIDLLIQKLRLFRNPHLLRISLILNSLRVSFNSNLRLLPHLHPKCFNLPFNARDECQSISCDLSIDVNEPRINVIFH